PAYGRRWHNMLQNVQNNLALKATTGTTAGGAPGRAVEPTLHYAAEIGKVALFSIVSLVTMFATTRLGGKRQISQMSIFDYANSITVGSIAAEMATNLESWYRPFTALLVRLEIGRAHV